MAHNVVVDHYRMAEGKKFDELDYSVPDHKREHNPIDTTENALDQGVLKVALPKLRKQYQDIILYKFINDLSNAEIAVILRKSEGGVRILQFRALKALKIELERMGVKYNF